MTFDFPDDNNNPNAQITDQLPGIRFTGTETGADDLTLRENAGTIELYDESVGAVAAAWNLDPQLENGSVAALDGSVTELREDTSANRPAAGTEGHIFFETDNGRILYDNGTSWIVIGTTNISETNHSAGDHEAGGDLALTLGSLASMDATAIRADTAANRPTAGTADRLFIETDTGTIYRDTGSVWNVMGTTNIADTDHATTSHTGFDTSEVLRDTTGAVQFSSAGTASVSITSGSTAVTTNTTRNGNYTKAQLTLTGTFTTATATASRGTNQLAQLTAAGTTTVTATTGTTSPTWTLSANLVAGSNATANLSPSLNQTTTINVN